MNFAKANGEVGHVYSQSGFDTIYPAFDLGREFTITFWLQFATRPSSVTNDTFQPVFFAQNVKSFSDYVILFEYSLNIPK